VLAIRRARSNPAVRGVVLRRVRVRAPLGPRGEEETSLRWVHGRPYRLWMQANGGAGSTPTKTFFFLAAVVFEQIPFWVHHVAFRN